MGKSQRNLKMPLGFEIHIDEDVKLILEFMSLNIQPSKCLKVAKTIQQLAPIMFQPSIDEHNSAEEHYIPLVFILSTD